MSTQTLLVLLVLVLGLNQIVARTGSLLANPYLWRVIVFLDAVVAAGVFGVGIPGFQKMPVIDWAVGALFVMHAGEFLFLREARLRQWGLWGEDDFDTRVARLTEEIMGDDALPSVDEGGDSAADTRGDAASSD